MSKSKKKARDKQRKRLKARQTRLASNKPNVSELLARNLTEAPVGLPAGHLKDLATTEKKPAEQEPEKDATDYWWAAEKHSRQHLDQPHTLKSVALLTGMSVRTSIRACKAATGLPPGGRIRQIRTTQSNTSVQVIRPSTAAAPGFGHWFVPYGVRN